MTGDPVAAPVASCATDITRVMVVLEHRDRVQAAVQQGVALARAHHAAVLFVDIPVPDAMPLVDGMGLSGATGTRMSNELHLHALRRQEAAMGVAHRAGVAAQIVSVASPHHVAGAAARLACDVIVVANPGRNAVMRLLSGNIVPMLITESHVPVLVCRPGMAAGTD